MSRILEADSQPTEVETDRRDAALPDQVHPPQDVGLQPPPSPTLKRARSPGAISTTKPDASSERRTGYLRDVSPAPSAPVRDARRSETSPTPSRRSNTRTGRRDDESPVDNDGTPKKPTKSIRKHFRNPDNDANAPKAVGANAAAYDRNRSEPGMGGIDNHLFQIQQMHEKLKLQRELQNHQTVPEPPAWASTVVVHRESMDSGYRSGNIRSRDSAQTASGESSGTASVGSASPPQPAYVLGGSFGGSGGASSDTRSLRSLKRPSGISSAPRTNVLQKAQPQMAGMPPMQTINRPAALNLSAAGSRSALNLNSMSVGAALLSPKGALPPPFVPLAAAEDVGVSMHGAVVGGGLGGLGGKKDLSSSARVGLRRKISSLWERNSGSV